MIVIADFWPYFLLSLAFFVVYFGLGHVLAAALGWRFKDWLEDFFAKNCLGWVLLTFLYALIKSGGVTVFSAALPLIAYTFYLNLNHQRLSFQEEILTFQRINWRDTNVFILVILLLTAAKLIKSYEPTHGFLAESFVDMDYCYYAQIADYLSLNGIENSNRGFNELDSSLHGINPYHYFELWQIAFWHKLTQLSSVYLFIFSFAIYVLGMLFLGFNLILRSLINKSANWLIYGLSFTFLFISVLTTGVWSKVPIIHLSEFMTAYMLHGPANPILDIKRSIVELYFVILFVLALRGSRQNAMLGVLFLSFLSVLLAPACLAGVFLYAFFALFTKEKDLKAYGLMGAAVVSAVLMGLVYALFAPELSQNQDTMQELSKDYSSFSAFLSSVGERVFYYFTCYWAAYLPFSAIVIYLWLRRDFLPSLNWFNLLLSYGYLVALLIGCLFQFFNWEQFYTAYCQAYHKLVFIVLLTAWLVNSIDKEDFNMSYFNFRTFKYLPFAMLLLYAWFGFRIVRNTQLKIKPLEGFKYEKKAFEANIQSKIVPYLSSSEANNAIFYYAPSNISKLSLPMLFNVFSNATYLFYAVPNLHFANFCYEQYEEACKDRWPFPKAVQNSMNTSEIEQFIRFKEKKGIKKSLLASKLDYIKTMRVKIAVIDKGAIVEPEIQALFGDFVEDKASGQRIYRFR